MNLFLLAYKRQHGKVTVQKHHKIHTEKEKNKAYMEEKRESSLSEEFISATSLSQMGINQVPQRFVLPPSQRPSPGLLMQPPSTTLPIIDFSFLHDPSLRPVLVDKVRSACQQIGFFQVINHGIPTSVMKDALDIANDFFNLPLKKKMHLLSDNVCEPVRYGTSMNHTFDEVHFWRDFIKHYAHPISKWIDLWPSNPPKYKEKMGKYAVAVQELEKQVIGIIFESLGLNPSYLKEEVEDGLQVMAVNRYPACPQPELALGMPPHSDYDLLTILLQTSPGLQLKDQYGNWVSVPETEGALTIQLGDQIEVLSNGHYKSVIHRVVVNSEKTRSSIASLHSLSMEKKIGPTDELVDEHHPMQYNVSSFRCFLDFIEDMDITKGRFIDTLKKQ